MRLNWSAVSVRTWIALFYSGSVRGQRRLHHLVRRGARDRQRADVGLLESGANRRDGDGVCSGLREPIEPDQGGRGRGRPGRGRAHASLGVQWIGP